MRRAFSWVVVRVAWHLTGATVALDWPLWESLGLGRLWIGRQATSLWLLGSTVRLQSPCPRIEQHYCGDLVASRTALLASDWHWLPRCMQSLNAASEVRAQQQPAPVAISYRIYLQIQAFCQNILCQTAQRGHCMQLGHCMSLMPLLRHTHVIVSA